MAEETKITKRKTPTFRRTDGHKKIRLGRGLRKNQKWHKAIGIQNKIRLGIRGKSARPKIGYGQPNEIRGKINGLIPIRVETMKDFEAFTKENGVIIGSVGAKKKSTLIAEANKRKITILNRYMEKKK